MADRPWSENEKLLLLFEVLKQVTPQFMSILHNIIDQHQQPPNWYNIVPPAGRTLSECVNTFNELRSPAQRQQHQQQPYGSYSAPPQTPTQPSAGPSGPLGVKRTYDSSFNRPLQPRPHAPGGAPYGPPLQERERPPKKKRGRPTKAEAQAKAEAQGSSGATMPRPEPSGRLPLAVAPAPVLPQPVEVRTTIYPNAGSSAFLEQAPARSPLPPTSRVPVHSLVTPTAPGSGSHSSSSSGKRRRGRSTRSTENQPEGEAEREAALARSPSERFAPPTVPAETQDTPARAAIMRHREEEEPSPPRLQPYRDLEERGGREQPPPPHSQGPERS